MARSRYRALFVAAGDAAAGAHSAHFRAETTRTGSHLLSLRLFAALAVAVLFGLAQLLPWPGATASRSDVPTQAAGRIAPSIALAATADNDEESDSDNSDADSDADNDEKSSSDNSDSGSDNNDSASDSDNSDSGSDNSDSASSSDNSDADTDAGDNSDGDTSATATTPPPPSVDATLPTAEATGTSNGSDVVIRLGGERVVVSMFPWMPSGVTLVVKRAEPAQFAAAPGTRAGDLLFTIEAKDATGKALTTLPGEINLSVRYNEADIKSLTESNLTISRLNTTSNQWSAAPKQVKSAEGNYIAASVSEPGAYIVHTP